MTIHCPTCDERAQHRVYQNDSAELAEGPAIRVCHASDGAYIHVGGEDGN